MRLFGNLTSSVNQLVFEPEARFILCFLKAPSPWNYVTWYMCISQKMCTGHHWFDRMVAYFPVLVLFLLGQSPRGEGSLGFFLAAARLQGWSTKGKLQLSCLLRDLLDKCSTELNEPGCHREALYFGSLGTNAWQTLAFRNLNHTTRNPAKLTDKISFANARRTGQLVEAPWQIQGTNRVTQTTVFGNRL